MSELEVASEQGAQMPSKATIAQYWRDLFEARRSLLKEYPSSMWIDWGEPDCWGCGRHDPKYPDWTYLKHRPDESWEQTFNRLWNSAALERHHILPVARGGLSDSGNLVLLCSLCHREAPHTTDTSLFWKWMHGRQMELIHRAMVVAERCLEECGLTLVDGSRAFYLWATDERFHAAVETRRGRYVLMFNQSFEARVRDWHEPLFAEYKRRCYGGNHLLGIDLENLAQLHFPLWDSWYNGV